jgi:hypothetical protein
MRWGLPLPRRRRNHRRHRRPPRNRPRNPWVAEADRYAVIYPQRAARIRALGGLPQPCDFGPPPPELVDAIVTGTSPTLRALEKV